MSKKKAMFFNSKGGGGFTAEYEAILSAGAAYTLPTAEQQSVQNQIIVDMKADGLWDTTDAMWHFKGSGDVDFKTINWKNPTGAKAFEVGTGALTWSSTGVLGDDVNYIDLAWNPTDDGTNYLQNDFSIAFDIITNYTIDGALLSMDAIGNTRSATFNMGSAIQYFHSTSNSARSFTSITGAGFYVMDFLTDTSYASKDGGTSFDTEGSKITDSFPSIDGKLLGIGSSGRGDMEIGSVIMGGSLDGSTTNYTNLYNAINGL